MRNKSIDILKSICAFLIVCIHIPFPGTVGEYFTTLTRIAVPLFFMITGYFFSDVMKKNGEVKQIRKILRLYIEANLLYFFWKLFLAVLRSNTAEFFQSSFSIKAVVKFLFLNESPFNGHLWYLGAILYVLITVLIADRLNCRKLLYVITPALLLGDLILGKYALLLWNREFPYIIVRNFLFVGIPYFCIGRLIKDGLGQKFNRRTLSVFLVLFSFTSLLERFLLISAGMNATRDHYISTTLLAVAVLLFTLKSNSGEENTNHYKNLSGGGYRLTDLMAVIGHRYSTWLYILHPIFITCIGMVMSKIGLYEVYRFVAPIVVYISTLVFLMIVDKVKNYYIDRRL